MTKYLINLDGYLRKSLTNSLKTFNDKVNMSFFCAKKKDKLYLIKDFPKSSVYCWEEFVEKNVNLKCDENDLLQIEKLIGITIIKANYSFYNYSQFYKSVNLSQHEKNQADLMRTYLNYKFYSEILEIEKPNIILHEHAGGSGSEILERISIKKDIKYYVFSTRFFENRFLLMDVKDNNFQIMENYYKNCSPNSKQIKAVKNIFLKLENSTSPSEVVHIKNISNKKRKRFVNYFNRIKEYYSRSKIENYILSNFPPFEDFIFERLKSKIRKYYVENFICEKQDKIFLENHNKQYVTFFLQSEPELIIYKLGGRHFSDQKSIIKNLALSLPSNFILLVKEHKSQGINSRYRNLQFFKDIKSYSNVRIVNSQEDPIKLINKSFAVANLSGTIGLEAIIRNKPLILFGSVFYQNYKNVFQIKKFEDLDNIIYRIIQNKENFKDENECLKFAFALRKTMFKGNIFDGSYLTKNNDLFLVESLKKLFSIYK